MEVVPTNDGDEDDGVIWFRCPQCQGFLPKLSGVDLKDEEPDAASDSTSDSSGDQQPSGAETTGDSTADSDDVMLWDSPAEMIAAQQAQAAAKEPATSPFLPEDDEVAEASEPTEPTEPTETAEAPGKTEAEPDPVFITSADRKKKTEEKPPESVEPIHEYVAMLAALDLDESKPYRPWESYELGQCIHHLAWEDCGVVVAKEDLPGGRKVIKCYFEDAGVVRLIEQAPQ